MHALYGLENQGVQSKGFLCPSSQSQAAAGEGRGSGQGAGPRGCAGSTASLAFTESLLEAG